MPRLTEPAVKPGLPTPNVVFFGFPNAGKTALLNAVLRAGSRTLGEMVVLQPADPDPNAVRREVVPHIVQAAFPRTGGESVVLLDCDGQSAAELLASPRHLLNRGGRGALAHAVHRADALVLVVDAGASADAVDHVFRAFRGFLDSLEEGRTFSREVGGLPVFLTLTKCDTLCLPNDEPTDWLARVESRKRELTDRFRDFFAEELDDTDSESIDPSPFLSFGSLDLQVVATAAQTPVGRMFDTFRDSEGSFGVDRFAVDCLRAAQAFHQRARSARRRLQFTVYGLLGLVALLFLGVLVLAFHGASGPTEALAVRIREYREREGPPSVRFADAAYPSYHQALQTFRDSPLFPGLPEDLRQYVTQRLTEVVAYEAFRTRFQPPQLAPPDLRTPDEIEQLNVALNTSILPPKDYADLWTETTAAKLRQKWQADLRVIQSTEQALYDWYRSLDRRANDLLFTPKPPTPGWYRESTALLERATVLPFDPSAEVPGSPTVPGVPRAGPLTFAAAFEFDRVLVARRDWEDARDRLQNLRSLTSVLGLTTGPQTPPAILDLPEPGDTVDSRTLASVRLQELEAAFPGTNPSHPEWVAAGFPDPVRNWLEPRLRATLETGVRHVHRLIRAKVGENDTAAVWRTLPESLLQEPAMRDWGRLLGRLRLWAALRESEGDPVVELADFLRQEAFPVELRAVDVSWPDDLLDRTATPAGDFVLTLKPADGGVASTTAFKPVGSARYERPLNIQRFEPKVPLLKWTIHPGDELSAILNLRSGGQEYRLLWSAGRSRVYQMDVVFRSPKLERVGPILFPPEQAAGVRLDPLPTTGWPTVPLLLPQMQRMR